MSSYFRMVSSSPPPLDDGASFEDDDADDEFGTFASVGHPVVDERVSPDRSDVQAPPTDVGRNDNDVPLPATDSGQRFWNGDFESAHDEFDGAGNGDEQETEVVILDGDVVSHDPVPETSPDSPRLPFRTATAADGASQDSVSDSGLCSASQLSDATFVDASPVASSGSEESPETVGSRDGDDAAPYEDAEEGDEVEDNRIRGDGTSRDGDRCSPRDIGDGEVSGNDDDDDFADFAGFEPVSESGWKPSAPPPATVGDGDDFADFCGADCDEREFVGDAASPPPAALALVSDADDSNPAELENFATFDEFKFQAPDEPLPLRAEFMGGGGRRSEGEGGDDDDDDDEFGNFDSAKPVDVVENHRILNAVGDTLSLTFPLTESRPEATISALDETLGPTLPSDADEESSGPERTRRGVWSQLYDVDSTHALTYRWGQSHSNQRLMRSLHIDSRNLLQGTKWNSAIPLFAATMSLNPLEPTKAVAKAGPDDDERSPGGGGGAAVATAAKFTGPTSTAMANGSCPQETLVIPPAQFDWSSSGLVNPLDELESELLGGDAEASSGNRTPRSGSSVQRASPLLEQILRQAAVSSAATFQQARRRSPNLSQEARGILDSLPDLSFMQAKVLMFPIRSAAVP